MPAFMRIGDIEGEATDQHHRSWIIIESLSAEIFRTIPRGARDQQRVRGETILADIVVVRPLDCSSPKLQEACANGTYFAEVLVHLCTTLKNRQEPYLRYRLKDVIVTSYSFHGHASGSPPPSEEVTLGFTEGEWTYVVIDPKTGERRGQVPGKYDPATGRSR